MRGAPPSGPRGQSPLAMWKHFSSAIAGRNEMNNDDYDAALSEWIICEIASNVFLAGRVSGDRKGRFTDGRWIITTLVVSPTDEIADDNIVQTVDSRYLLKDRHAADDALFTKLDAWLAEQPDTLSILDVIATNDRELMAAYVLHAFRAAAAEAVWRRDGGE